MDYAACNVVYVDRSAKEDKLVKRDDAISTESVENVSDGHALRRDPSPVRDNVRTLLGTFSEGKSKMKPKAVYVLIDV